MGVYTKLLSDAEIIQNCGNADTILVLGCGSCANESLAFLKNTYISKIIQNERGEKNKIPYAVTHEIERITKFLNNKGISVKTMTINNYGENTVCTLDENDIEPIKQEIPLVDMILALCCPAGQMGIREIIGNSIRILPIVKVVGTLYCHFEETDDSQKILKEKCIAIPFYSDE